MINQPSCRPLALFCLAWVLAGPLTFGEGLREVDLNEAGIGELTTLPGIGPVIARRIVDFREENGPFQKIEDLLNVRGIGERKFLELRGQVKVGSTREEAEKASSPRNPENP